MKKIISIILVISVFLTLVACSSGDSSETTDTSPVNDSDTVPVISLLCDKTEVSAGDMLSVYVHIKNAAYTACFDIYIYADERLAYELASSQVQDSKLILAANYLSGENEGYVAIRGIVATSFDLVDDNIYKIDYKVSEDVQSGDKLNLNLQVPSYQLALDSSGNDVYSVNEYLQINNLTVTVK